MKRQNVMLITFLFLVSCQMARRGPVAATTIDLPIPRVHFMTNTSILDDEVKLSMQQNVSWFEHHPRAVVVLEGHCDEWGDDPYNMELGDRRARSVKAFLVARGVNADRMIMIVSRGERDPLDPRHTADAWRLNRRVEFVVR